MAHLQALSEATPRTALSILCLLATVGRTTTGPGLHSTVNDPFAAPPLFWESSQSLCVLAMH